MHHQPLSNSPSYHVSDDTECNNDNHEWRYHRDHDQICLICKKWCINTDDFINNFRTCKICPNSFHRQCIPNKYRYIKQRYSCDTIFNNIIDNNDDNNNNKNTPKKQLYSCDNNNRRQPKVFFKALTKLREPKNYIYNNENKAIYWFPHEVDKRRNILTNNHDSNKTIHTVSKCTSILYKGKKYSIGDSVELEDVDGGLWNSSIVMIQDIFIYDEPLKEPTINVFKYWRERELQQHLKQVKKVDINLDGGSLDDISRKKYIDNHLYLDIVAETDNIIEEGVYNIMHKILMAHDFDDFLEKITCKFAEYGGVFYGSYAYTWINYVKYGNPFEKISHIQIKQTIIQTAKTELNKYRYQKNHSKQYIEYKNKEIKQQNIARCYKVQNFLNKYTKIYDIDNPDDDHKCMQIYIPTLLDNKNAIANEHDADFDFDIDMMRDNRDKYNNNNNNDRFRLNDNNNNNNNNGYFQMQSTTKKQLKQRKQFNSKSTMPVRKMKQMRKPKMNNKDILRDNMSSIPENDQNRMKQICNELGIRRGMHIGVRLYGYKTHLDVYEDLLNIVKNYNNEKQKEYIEQQSSNKLRDIKTKIQSSGILGRKGEMINGIVKKLQIFNINYNNNNNDNDIGDRKRKREIDDDGSDESDQFILPPANKKRRIFLYK